MSSDRFFYNAGAKVVDGSALSSPVTGTHDNRFGSSSGINKADRGYQFLTISWDYTYSAATELIWTAEISMEFADSPTDWVDVSESIIQSGADELEQYNPKVILSAQNETGTLTVPMRAGTQCRITCTATGGAAGDLISWRACAHN